MNRRPDRSALAAVAAALAVAAVMALSATFIASSTPDEEEFRFAILSTWLHVDALRHLRLEFWTGLLGLGVPQPFSPAFLLHPLSPLLAVISPGTWARILLVFHTLLGACGMWRLTRALRLTSTAGALCVTTFLLATPVQNYALVDFWPSHYLVWTSAPWLLLLAYTLFGAEQRALPFWSVATGLVSGLVVANTNPGHVVVYGTLVAALVVTFWREAIRRAWWIGLAIAIAAAIAAPGLVQLARERPLFASNLESWNLPAPLPPWAAWNVLIGPFGRVDERLPFARTLFFGGPFALLALYGCLRFARRQPELVLTVALSALLLFTSTLQMPFLSARYQFRDPLILAAIPLAGLAFDILLAAPRRWLATTVLVAQIAALLASAWPAWSGAWIADARAADWFRGGAGTNSAVERLLELARPPGRALFSPQIDDEIFEESRSTQAIGVNALAYRGFPVVNGWFKGVSTAQLWPDERMLYGRIRVPAPLISSAAALDLLGVRYVLANPDEAVAPDLQRRGTIIRKDQTEYVVYENPNAWPEAFLTPAASAAIELPLWPGCENDRLLCRDLSPLAALRIDGDPVVTQTAGTIDVAMVAATEPRLLVVTQMFRPDWVATARGQQLRTRPIADGLLGVEIPGGIEAVRLRYQPSALVAATVTAWLTLAGALVALLALRCGASLHGSPREP
jgi:hypothetical protein